MSRMSSALSILQSQAAEPEGIFQKNHFVWTATRLVQTGPPSFHHCVFNQFLFMECTIWNVHTSYLCCWRHNTIIHLPVFFRVASPGHLFTKRKDVLPQDLVKFRCRWYGCFNHRIALKFDKRLTSAVAELCVKHPSDWKRKRYECRGFETYERNLMIRRPAA